jgi:hypothetical protein
VAGDEGMFAVPMDGEVDGEVGGELGGGGTGAVAARVRAQPAAAKLASTSSQNERQAGWGGGTFLPWPVSRPKS